MAVYELNIGGTTKRSQFKPVPVTVDWDKLPEASREFLIRYGIKQQLADGGAGAKTQADWESGIKERLTKIMEGDFSRTRGEAKAKPDTVEQRAAKLAKTALLADIKAAGLAPSKEQIAEAVADLIKADPSYTAEAKKQIAAEAKLREAGSAEGNPLAALVAKMAAKQAGAVDDTESEPEGDDEEGDEPPAE